MEESILYKDKEITVTTKEFRHKDNKHSMSNVTRALVTCSNELNRISIGLLVIAVFFWFVEGTAIVRVGLVWTLASYLFFVLFLMCEFFNFPEYPKPTYSITVDTDEGSKILFYSQDRNYIEKVVEAINAGLHREKWN